MTLQRSLVRLVAQRNIIMAKIVPPGHVFRARIWTTKPEDLPRISIFTRTDDQTSKGKSTPPSFDAEPTLEFEIGLNGDDPEAIEDELDVMCERLIDCLMTDPDFIRLVEEVKSIKTAIDMKEGEFQYARARISLTFAYTEAYEPVIPNELELIDAKVVDYAPSHPDVPRVIAEIKIDPQA